MMIVVVLLFVLSSGCYNAMATADKIQQKENIHPPVIEWLISEDVGGYFNTESIAVRNGGMYASKDIRKGDSIMKIPPEALIYNKESDEEDECETARRLVYEYDVLGEEKSFYWPYLQYVFESFPHRTVPLGWTKEGKKILRSIVGRSSLPRSYGRACGDDNSGSLPKFESDPDLFEAAFRIVLSRGWHHVMVPVYDMVNHRNYHRDQSDGGGHNIDRSSTLHNPSLNLDVDGDFQIEALRDIKRGDQLHNSYNQCHDITCDDIDTSYITSSIFIDYGFVEDYPRRFAFHTDNDEHDPYLGIVVEIVSDKEMNFILPSSPSELNEHQVNWLQDELEHTFQKKNKTTERIERHKYQHSNEDNSDDDKQQKQHEAYMLLEYYNALTEAIELTVKSTTTTTTKDNEL